EEELAKPKPFIVVHVPQWVTRLISKRDRTSKIEIVQPSETAEAEETSIPETPADKPETSVAEIQLPTTEEMKANLLAETEIPETAFHELARKRIETIQSALLESGQVERDRVSTGPAQIDSVPKAKFRLQ